MSERERKKADGHVSLPLSASGRGQGGGVNVDDARLRSLCAAADLPLHPSDGLRRRVAESAVRHDALAARLRSPWQGWNTGWAPAAGAVAATFLLAFLGLRLMPGHRMPVSGSKPPRLAQQHLQKMAAAPSRSHTGRSASDTPSSARPRTHGVPSPAVRRAATSPPSAAPVDDLVSVNGNLAAASPAWSVPAPGRAPTPAGADPIEQRARPDVPVRDDFIWVPFPRIASTSDRQAAAAAEQYRREAAVVDARLSVAVTVEQKGTALADLCERLRADSGIQLGAGQSVADEKVTFFCEKVPLRDVMRQLSRPFGYTWLRSGKQGEYKYELVQDLRSQLLEEELRNRDRNAALIALDQEMQRYRPYLTLSPEEALARAQTASPAEKWLLERYGHQGWGPVRMYFRLSPQELATLRTGRQLLFSQEPRPDERPLPPDLTRGVLQSMRDLRFRVTEKGYEPGDARTVPDGLPPANLPEARAKVTLALNKSDLGQIALRGGTRIAMSTHSEGDFGRYYDPIGVGVNPAVRDPQNAVGNARLAHDLALRPRVSIRPQASCRAFAAAGAAAEPRVTTADALEALHQSTGLPIVADYYTRLYPPGDVSVQNIRLFDALNQFADTMRLRWSKEGNWLQFRSTSFYDDRLKEVPNRLLTRWSASGKEHGALTLEDLLEIVQLSDTQLDAGRMAEGAKICFGLAEWDLARNDFLRPHLRYLAGLAPAQRQQAQSAAALAFTRMSLPQQQGFLSLAFGSHTDGLPSLEDLAGASLQVDYSPAGSFEWGAPHFEWGTPQGPHAHGWMAFRRLPVRERTREAALQAARRFDPQVDTTQITPTTEPAIRILYSSGPNPRLRPGGVLATATGAFDLTISRVSP